MENVLANKTELVYMQAFIESPIIMTISTLKEGRYIEINNAFQKILGYDRDKVIGRTSEELGFWHGRWTRADILTILKEKGKFQGEEVNLLAKTSELMTFLTSAEIIETKEEQFLLVLMEDITARKRSEAELAASQVRLRQIAEVAQDLIYSVVLTPEVKFEFISPSVRNVLGYSIAEIQNDPKWIFSHIEKDDRLKLASFISFPNKQIDPQPVVLRWRHKDGHIVYVEHRTSLVFDEQSQVTSFIGIGRDITARRETQEQLQLNESRLESLLKLSQFDDPDIQHLLDYALQEAIQLTRSKLGSIYYYFEDTQELVLNSWSREAASACKIMKPSAKHQLNNTGLWGESIRQHKPIVVNDYAAPNPLKKGYPAGHVELSRFMSVPVYLDGKIVAVVGVANKDSDYDQSDIRQLTLLMDSTWKLVEYRRRDEARRQAAQKLQDSYQKEKLQREELQEEAKARGLFIDVLAHELRTPLTPILASSGMLRDLLEGQEGILRRLTANLYNSADNMAHRLEELLDLARYARGTFKLNIQPIKMGNYLTDVIERSLPIIEQNKQILKLEVASELPTVQIDSSRMEQVILNLLSNACKFSPEKSEIGFKAQIESGYLQIDVKDQGIGIAAEDHEMLFQPYHRVVQDRQKYPGIGLGLAVAKQIVEAHGGKIWLTSQLGAGSTFSLCIPLEYSDK